MTAAHPPYASASLYVGDLSPEANETVLLEVFNAIGPVASIRVCRDAGTRKSLGYAYVNYHFIHHAERALDTLNFTCVKNVPCRIMWSHRDPSLRKSGTGNIFVKNLDKSIDNKSLYDTFSLFGNILSCKVATDEFGNSRGYGFVHYETEEAAKAAIEKVNDMLIGSKNVYVGPFKKRAERHTTRSRNFTNLYVKHFPECWTDETLHRLFSPFGGITSHAITTDSKGRRFGFVNYVSCDSARDAVLQLHGKRVSDDGIADDQSEEKAEEKKEAEGKKEEENGRAENDDSSKPTQTNEDTRFFYVQRAMSKGERISLLKEQFNNNNVEKRKQQQQGVNLFIKNLDPQATDERLTEAFSKYGTVTSAKIMRDEAGDSKGFGFVCFAFSDDATKAVNGMNYRLFMGKPLYVALAENREHRAARFQQRLLVGRPNAGPLVVGSNGSLSHHPQLIQSYGTSPQVYFGGAQGPAQQRAVAGPGFAHPEGAWRQQAAPRNYAPGFQVNPAMAPGTPMHPYHQAPMGHGINPFSSNPANNSGHPMRGIGVARPRSMGMQQGAHMGGQPGQPNFKFTPQARNRDFPQSHHHVVAQAPIQQTPLMDDPTMLASGDLSAQTLAALRPKIQKRILGEKLFPLVAKLQPELAGKITGMLLEMDNTELLSLLCSEPQLRAKVNEALEVLHRHQAAGPSSADGENPSPVNPAA